MTIEEVYDVIYGEPVPVAPPAAPRDYSGKIDYNLDPEERGTGRKVFGGCYVNYGMMGSF
jgi:hypothetical protein